MGPRNRFSETVPLRVDVAALGRDLYLLLACVLSSKRYAEQTYEKDYDVLQSLRDAHEQREIGSLLLSIAVRVRVLDDRDEISKRTMAIGCGSLVTDAVHGENKTPLTLREACNKIVHSRGSQLMLSHFDSFDAQLPSPTSTHMEPSLMLHGTKNRKTWRASFNLVKFVRAIIRVGVVHDANHCMQTTPQPVIKFAYAILSPAWRAADAGCFADGLTISLQLAARFARVAIR